MIRTMSAALVLGALLGSGCEYTPVASSKPGATPPAPARPIEQGPAHSDDEHGDEAKKDASLPWAKVFVQTPAGEVSVKVEVAANPPARQRGLMFRQKLAEDEGMLFLFPASEQLSFWMRNTYLPLDMIFIKSDLTVLGVVEGAKPLTEDSRAVPGESQFVLEVNATYARRHQIGPGTKVRFEGTDLIPVE